MTTKSHAAWAMYGILSWMLVGTALTVMFAFEPQLTSIPLTHSLPTLLAAVAIFAMVGVFLGFGGRSHSRSVGFGETEQGSTMLALMVWGATMGALVFGLFFLLPSVDGTVLRSALYRCAAGGVAGLLAGSFTAFLALPSTHQLSESAVRVLVRQMPTIHSEIFLFFEPGTETMPGQDAFIPNVLGEFREPALAVVYGSGRGHAFVRVSAINSISGELSSSGYNWKGLVSALEGKGYCVKRIHYFASYDPRAT